MSTDPRASFEAVVQPARDVVTTVTNTGGTIVNTVVNDFEEAVGQTLEELGIDAQSLEALAEQGRGALAALLSAKQTILNSKGALEGALADVNAVANEPLSVLLRGENLAAIQKLFQEEARARNAAWMALGLLSDFIDTLDGADRTQLRDAIAAIDPRFSDWLDRA